MGNLMHPIVQGLEAGGIQGYRHFLQLHWRQNH